MSFQFWFGYIDSNEREEIRLQNHENGLFEPNLMALLIAKFWPFKLTEQVPNFGASCVSLVSLYIPSNVEYGHAQVC